MNLIKLGSCILKKNYRKELCKSRKASTKSTKLNKKISCFSRKEKMRVRIEKLRLRKGNKFDAAKICHNCRKDFKDVDNFNWSCRTHQSEWSGEMWWCCGKSTIDAPGCKFGKHQTAALDEDE